MSIEIKGAVILKLVDGCLPEGITVEAEEYWLLQRRRPDLHISKSGPLN